MKTAARERAEVEAKPAPAEKLTFEEFLTWCDEDTWAEWVDGEVIIVSPAAESRARDRGEKFYEYEAAGIGEYWLIDPDRQQAEFYRLGADGRYRLLTARLDTRLEPIPCGERRLLKR